MKSLTKEERQAVARRIFEALCTHYPDRYIALVGQPGSAEIVQGAILKTDLINLDSAKDSGDGSSIAQRGPGA